MSRNVQLNTVLPQDTLKRSWDFPALDGRKGLTHSQIVYRHRCRSHDVEWIFFHKLYLESCQSRQRRFAVTYWTELSALEEIQKECPYTSQYTDLRTAAPEQAPRSPSELDE